MVLLTDYCLNFFFGHVGRDEIRGASFFDLFILVPPSCLRACLRACLRVRARRCRGFASERLSRTVAPHRLSLGEEVRAVRGWYAYRPPWVCTLVVSLLVVAQG